MPTDAREYARRLWGALNAALALVVVGYGAVFVFLVLALGTDHSEVAAAEWLRPWAIGALGGLATALLAGRYDRRYLPWTAALVLAGVCAAPLLTAHFDTPAAPLVVPLAVSIVWHARAGRHAERRTPRYAVLTGVLVTVMALTVVGAAVGHVVLASRSTPEYAAMRSDPLAAERLPGLALRFDWSQDNTTPFGMRSPAQVSRSWTITDGSTTAAKIAELEALAERHEWAVAEDPVFCGWRKSIAGHPLCLVIRSGQSPDEVVVEITGGRAAPSAS
ncbi:hypothetical protein GHK92_05345 [Nocardioides sp. dk4132]|uniref:hypothetical protein n=1 Tax=unclassified Nocardioides TaxID=2615069 RepID=UPI0012948FAD|nr:MULTISPECIES: hypothetical protein [unclassified Nocardioides]MQW75292.1 hypothetical protein [Nocardioides sp. dk4132]QGA07558.1 hypothetical protein GFH29_09265 [Nocardioides sp. dk884]